MSVRAGHPGHSNACVGGGILLALLRTSCQQGLVVQACSSGSDQLVSPRASRWWELTASVVAGPVLTMATCFRCWEGHMDGSALLLSLQASYRWELAALIVVEPVSMEDLLLLS